MLTIAPLPALDHLRADGLAAVPEPVDVDVPDVAPLLVGHLERGPVVADAGVVDEHVDRSELLDDRREHRAARRRVGDVGRARRAPRARRPPRAVRSRSRAAIATSRARLGSARANAPPRPRLPPVTTATRPSRPEGVEHAHGCDHRLHAAGILAAGAQRRVGVLEREVAGDDRVEVDAPGRGERDRRRVGVRVAERPGEPRSRGSGSARAGARRSPRPHADEHRGAGRGAARSMPAAAPRDGREHSISTSASERLVRAGAQRARRARSRRRARAGAR